MSLAKRLEVGFEEISGALAEINRHRYRPVGRLRLNVLKDGAKLLLVKYLPAFLSRYPDVEVEIAVDDRMVDIVSAGFDAGIRFGGTVPEDFVAVRIGGQLRWVAAASPRYLNGRAASLEIPEDLKHHECIQIRTGQGTIYRWDFEKEGEHRSVEVRGQLCVNETTLGIDMAVAGRGITYCLENRVEEYVKRGELQLVLQDWCPLEPAFNIYYPGRRQMPPGLKELIDVFRESAEAESI